MITTHELSCSRVLQWGPWSQSAVTRAHTNDGCHARSLIGRACFQTPDRLGAYRSCRLFDMPTNNDLSFKWCSLLCLLWSDGCRVSHAERVVDGLSEERIEAFVRGWRAHFLSTMRPRHLPPHWSVDSRVASSGQWIGRKQAEDDDGAVVTANREQ